MPSEIFHQNLTAQALRCAAAPDTGELASRYCCYPDEYFGPRHEETKPYMYFHDGIQFHYPPHTPVEEFYRYWDHDENGNHLLSTRPNENIRHVEAGFRFYFTRTLELLRQNQNTEAWKFLGCLLHFLEDSTFGIHAFEGADGTDIFILDRLTGQDTTKQLCAIDFTEELAQLTVTPQILSANVEETVSLLYARYVRATGAARQYLFDIALDKLCGRSQRPQAENIRLMYQNALQLTADAAATLFALDAAPTPQISARNLTAFSPFRYPIGGAGGFALRRCEEDIENNTVTFGVNSEAFLLYNIPRDLYKRFTVTVTGEESGQVTLHLISDGKISKSLELVPNAATPLVIECPGGEVGFKITSTASAGRIKISNGLFHL